MNWYEPALFIKVQQTPFRKWVNRQAYPLPHELLFLCFALLKLLYQAWDSTHRNIVKQRTPQLLAVYDTILTK
jgi:hypothetical protein